MLQPLCETSQECQRHVGKHAFPIALLAIDEFHQFPLLRGAQIRRRFLCEVLSGTAFAVFIGIIRGIVVEALAERFCVDSGLVDTRKR